jgi:o-succinylbenzoate---CoA ligase
MLKYQERITLNGKTFSGSEIAQLAELKLSLVGLNEYEKHLYHFIKEWISPINSIMLKTSGTTGESKEITVLKSKAIASAQMTCEYFGLNKNTDALLCLSTEYIGGKMMIVRAFVSGMNLITVEPDSNPLFGLNTQIDFASMVPLQVNNCLENENTKSKFISIPEIIIGGAALSSQLEKELAKCSNNVYSTFAMTETLSHIALRKLSGINRDDYYKLLPGISILIDKRNCLVINTPALDDKPIITNDMVEIINPTSFRWLGRYDNVINSGGIKIHPEMVERKLSSLINQNRFFITSLPDEKLGEKVTMVIECGNNFEIKEIITHTGKILSKYEMPKDFYHTDKFLETATGKVKKTETMKISTRF